MIRHLKNLKSSEGETLSSKSEILAEISALREKIEIYQNCIEDLKNTAKKTSEKHTLFDSNICSKIREYDISVSGVWKGNNESKAADSKRISANHAQVISDKVEQMLNDIERTIQKYMNMITDCRHKIASLKRKLSSLPE